VLVTHFQTREGSSALDKRCKARVRFTGMRFTGMILRIWPCNVDPQKSTSGLLNYPALAGPGAVQDGVTAVLVSADVALRGLGIQHVHHGLPRDVDTYVHRIDGTCDEIGAVLK